MIGRHASCDRCTSIRQKCHYDKVPANPTIPRGRNCEAGTESKPATVRATRRVSKAATRVASTSKITEKNVGGHDEAEETTFDGLPIPNLRDPYFDQNPSRRRQLLRSAEMSLLIQWAVIERSLLAINHELTANSKEDDWAKDIADIQTFIDFGDRYVVRDMVRAESADKFDSEECEGKSEGSHG
jgi:hypothetical protein